MNFQKYLVKKNKFDQDDFCNSLDLGSCVKIKNSKKIFQVIGINPKNKICWLREWPLAFEPYKTFALATNQITIQTYCSKTS